MTIYKTENAEYYECPWCGHEEDARQYERDRDVTCGECDQPFTLRVTLVEMYTTDRIETAETEEQP